MRVRLTGIHVAVLLVYLAGLASAFLKPFDCDVHVTPQVGIAPISLLRVRTTIEPKPEWRQALVTLYDDFSVRTASEIHVDRRTTEFDWKDLYLDEGEYEVRLVVVGTGNARCTASVRVEAHGQQSSLTPPLGPVVILP